MSACIYCIENKVNGHCYIGQTINFQQRKLKHQSELRLNRHCNPHLQKAYNKYGAENFDFYIIEQVDDYSTIGERERYWIEQKGYYNIDTGRDGFTPTALRNFSSSHKSSNINKDKRKFDEQHVMWILAVTNFCDSSYRPLGKILNVTKTCISGIAKGTYYKEFYEQYNKLSLSERLKLFDEGLSQFSYDWTKVKCNASCPMKTRYIRYLYKIGIEKENIYHFFNMCRDSLNVVLRDKEREVNTSYTDEEIRQILLVLCKNNTVLSSYLEKSVTTN